MIRRLPAARLALVATSLTVMAVPAGGQEPPRTAGSVNYQVGPNDVLEVTVFNQQDLTRTVQVTLDGTVSLGLVGNVPVAGLNAKQVQDKLELLYKEYLVNPQVFVVVKEHRSQVVQVFGAVRNPGQHRLTGPSKVLDVLSMIGGLSDTGGTRLVLLRPREVKETDEARGFETLEIDVHRLLAEGDTEQNLVVQAGDVLFVPRADEVYVLGEVKNPGAVKFEEGLTLTQAISKVAGFTRTASRRVQVVRVEQDKKTQRDYHVGRIESGKERDPVLQARDLVVVPESIF